MVCEHPFSMEHDERFQAIFCDLHPEGEHYRVASPPFRTARLRSRRSFRVSTPQQTLRPKRPDAGTIERVEVGDPQAWGQVVKGVQLGVTTSWSVSVTVMYVIRLWRLLPQPKRLVYQDTIGLPRAK